jgi:hypothetical protein
MWVPGAELIERPFIFRAAIKQFLLPVRPFSSYDANPIGIRPPANHQKTSAMREKSSSSCNQDAALIRRLTDPFPSRKTFCILVARSGPRLTPDFAHNDSRVLESRCGQKQEKQNQTNQKRHMKYQSTTKALLAGAAIAGIMSGGLVAKLNAATATSTDKSTVAAAGVLADEKKPAKEAHDCAGKNSCKGKGGCKTGDAGCKGKNSCKGKGGCKVEAKK